MKIRLIAISLLVALAGWMFIPPPKTVASQTETKTEEITSPSSALSSLTTQSLSTKTNQKQFTPLTLERRKEMGGEFSGRHYSPQEVQQLVRAYSVQYGISPDLPLAIARCESGFNQFAKNKSSTASGVPVPVQHMGCN